MSMTTRVKVKKEIYIWAIDESQIEYDVIKFRFNKIDEWISGVSCPTFRQLEELANFLKIPFGYMFLNKPPKKDIMESEFRTIGNKMPHISKNLKDTLSTMAKKKDWLSEYRKEKGWEKVLTNKYSNFNKNDSIFTCKLAKEFLELDEFWYKNFTNTRLAFNYLRELLENKGIIVMQNGIVGVNTQRNLDINEFRGFLLYDDYAPLIFINAKDSANGKIFTLIHEYIHFLLREDDVFINEFMVDETTDEALINKIAAEFLIPESHVSKLWDNSKDPFEQIEELSRSFHVSQISVAIKLKNTDKVDQHIVDNVKNKTDRMLRNKTEKSSGGDFYNNCKSRYSDSFARSVVQGAESGEISYTYAFDLFDGSIKTYDYFKEGTMDYGGYVPD